MKLESEIWEIQKREKRSLIRPKTPLLCPVCGERMVMHAFRVSFDSVKRFYHCDVHLKCPKCWFYATFGVPVSEDEHKILTESEYHGKVLTDELLVDEFGLIKEEQRIIEARLKTLRYW